jgi:hypothetical protein
MSGDFIEKMELELSGEDWNSVTLSQYSNGRRIEHKYSNVRKATIMKLLNASKSVKLSEFDAWLKEEDAKRKKEQAKDFPEACSISNDWWTAR